MTLLTPEQRLQVINAAPGSHGDHVVAIDSTVHAVVRVDGLGRRIVALAGSAAEAIERAKPKAAVSASESGAQSQSRRGSRRDRSATAEKRKIDANVFAAELAEYRRAVAAAGIETPELL